MNTIISQMQIIKQSTFSTNVFSIFHLVVIYILLCLFSKNNSSHLLLTKLSKALSCLFSLQASNITVFSVPEAGSFLILLFANLCQRLSERHWWGTVGFAGKVTILFGGSIFGFVFRSFYFLFKTSTLWQDKMPIVSLPLCPLVTE